MHRDSTHGATGGAVHRRIEAIVKVFVDKGGGTAPAAAIGQSGAAALGIGASSAFMREAATTNLA